MDPRYPIGKFETQPFSQQIKQDWINDIKFLPGSIEMAVNNLDEAQLDTPYREGGWTVRQLVHHVADSHINAYCRLKLGLTEENPTIRPYEEQLWAELPDTFNVPINVSITLLHALHLRWHNILINLDDKQWERTIYHPGNQKQMTLWNLLGVYSWHGRHHVEHINQLRAKNGW